MIKQIIYLKQTLLLNKRPICHIANMRNQYKSKNTNVQSYVDLKRKKTLIGSKDALCQFSWNWLGGSGEEGFKFLLFHNYLFLEKGVAFYLNKLESPLPKDALCQVWLKFAQWFLRRRCLQTDRQTTNAQKSSLELSAEVSLNYWIIANTIWSWFWIFQIWIMKGIQEITPLSTEINKTL